MVTEFAENTKVPVEKSKMELDTLLMKHGAANRGVQTDDINGKAAIAFVLAGLKYRLEIPLPRIELLPAPGDEPRGWRGWSEEDRAAWVRKEWEQSCRSRWRAVLLLVKAKLELVRLKVSTVEKEFFADLVVPGGQTMHAAMSESIQRALVDGTMPVLMLPEST